MINEDVIKIIPIKIPEHFFYIPCRCSCKCDLDQEECDCIISCQCPKKTMEDLIKDISGVNLDFI